MARDYLDALSVGELSKLPVRTNFTNVYVVGYDADNPAELVRVEAGDLGGAGSGSGVALILAPMPFFGELTDEQVFGYFKAPFDCDITGTQSTMQDAPTGSDATFDIVNSSNVEQSKVSTITAGAKEAETIFGTALSLDEGQVCRCKVKSVGSTYAGAWANINLIVTPR